jgi:hypothetical protein
VNGCRLNKSAVEDLDRWIRRLLSLLLLVLGTRKLRLEDGREGDPRVRPEVESDRNDGVVDGMFSSSDKDEDEGGVVLAWVVRSGTVATPQN